MKLRIGLRTAFDDTDCTPNLLPIINMGTGVQPAHVLLQICGQTIFDDYIDNMSDAVATGGFAFNNSNNSIEYDYIRKTDVGGNRVIIEMGLTLEYTWDSADILIQITDGSTITYHTYTNTFTVYGYDLGNDVDGLITFNPEFNIHMITTANTYVDYPNLIAYRKPFTDQINIYHATSYFNGSVAYYETTELLSNSHNSRICHDETITIIQRHGDCQTSVTVPHIQFVPLFEVQHNCPTCIDNCVNIFDTPQITVAVDYSSVTVCYIDDNRYYWYQNQFSSVTILNNSGTVISENIIHQYLPPAYDSVPLPTNLVVNYTIPNAGSYIVRGCIGALGIYEQISETEGSIETQHYYCVQSKSTLTGADFDNLCDPAGVPVSSIFYTDGTTLVPTDWGTYGKLFEVQVERDVVANKFYKIVRLTNGADFDNLTNHIGGSLGGDIFILAVDTAPTSWGSAPINPSSENYSGGAIVEVTPVITCCRDIVINGCYPYNLLFEDCDTFTLTNLSTYDLTYVLQFLGDSGFATVDTGTITPYGSTPDYLQFELSNIGVYNLIITIDGNVLGNRIIISNCEALNCKLGYLKKLMCCNPETNCDDCHDDDCNKKNTYDFNAFTTLMNIYFNILNDIASFNYVYSDPQLVTAMDSLYELSDVIDRASAYCMECDEPCKEC